MRHPRRDNVVNVNVRSAVLVTAVFLFGAAAAIPACSERKLMCVVGSERCACTQGGGCDPGLLCLSQICVSPVGLPPAGDGGDASMTNRDAGMDAPADLAGPIDAPPDGSPGSDRFTGTDTAGTDTAVKDGSGGTDVPPEPCPPGTEMMGAVCVTPGPVRVEVRLAATQLPADGYSRMPVLVLATSLADGSPALVPIVLSLTRPAAGLFDKDKLVTTALGGSTYFIPCSSATAGCLGKVRVQVALADDPTTIVAASPELELVQPAGVGSPAACLTGGNVMFFDGNDYIYNGLLTVTNAVFATTGSSTVDLQLAVNPRDVSQGSNWRLWFSSSELDQPLREQVYRMAERAPFASPGHPGIDIGGSGRGCNTISGEFEIVRLLWAGNQLRELTIVFNQHCERGATSLRGCIHIEQ
jgi:hypothetical protein